MRSDGAIVVERASNSDRLPWLVNFGNGGNASAEGDDLYMNPVQMRRIAEEWKDALSPICDSEGSAAYTDHRGESISYNEPYKGSFEVQSLTKLSKRLGLEPHVFQV